LFLGQPVRVLTTGGQTIRAATLPNFQKIGGKIVLTTGTAAPQQIAVSSATSTTQATLTPQSVVVRGNQVLNLRIYY